MEVILLGTGTSSGVPQLRCDCPVCRSTDSRDKRRRSAALVATGSGKRILIDCGPDMLRQLLDAGGPERIDAVLITHSHYDHIAGLDELRPFCENHPEGLPIYCTEDVAADLRSRIPYCFYERPRMGVPHFRIHIVGPESGTFMIEGDRTEIEAIGVNHGKLPIVGYRLDNFAYITDCTTIRQGEEQKIVGVDTLVINALRHEKHPTHMNLDEALAVIKTVAPRFACLTHFSHGIGLHAETSAILPDNVIMGYDELRLQID